MSRKTDWLDEQNWTADARACLEMTGGFEWVVAGTGHRPPRLGLGYSHEDLVRLAKFAGGRLKAMPRLPDLVVTGGAQGWDQALAFAANLLGIPYVVAVPFVGQESKWPAEAQDRYHALLAAARRVVTVCGGRYDPKKFIARDRWMVRAAHEVVALWDGDKSGGTWATVSFAQSLGRPINNLWDRWAVTAV